MRAKLGTPQAQLESLRRWRRTALGLTITATLAWSFGAWFHATSAPLIPGPEHCGGQETLAPVPGCSGLWAPRGSQEFRVYSLMCAPETPELVQIGLGDLLEPDGRHFALADECLYADQLYALAHSPQVWVRHYVYRRASEQNAWTPDLVELALFDDEPANVCAGCICDGVSGRDIALGVMAGES